jgi:hypothetical protein
VVDSNPLHSLLRECVVRIDAAGEFRGTGFFVAPGEVLTCAHVVHGVDDVSVSGPGWQSAATVELRAPDLAADDPEAGFYPLPDVALLRVADSPDSQPQARLETDFPVAGDDADTLWLVGYCRGVHEAGRVERSGAIVEFETLFEETGWELFMLKDGQVVGGFSGCPVLNARTGSVCGLIDSSRNEAADLGGFAVPMTAVGDAIPGLIERNAALHPAGGRWDTCVRDERAAGATRSGEAEMLPLLDPMSKLEPSPDHAPSDLLKPRYGVVGLIDRRDLQAELMRWREREERLGIVLMTGGGGFGKTRLAVEECERAQQAGWTAGLLALDASASADTALDRLARWEGRLFVAVDYAETRPALVGSLILRLARRTAGPPVRLILVCRQVQPGRGMADLFATGDGRDEIIRALDAAEPVRLDAHTLDSRRLFEAGVDAFTKIMAGSAKAAKTPALRGDHFARPLFVLSAALLAARDPELDIDAMSRDELMLELIERHESQYWERWNASLEADLDASMQRRAVAVATLLGAESEQEAISLVGIIPALEEATAERRRTVARWLSQLYGNGRLDDQPAIRSMEPDMLGEALIVHEYVANPALLGATLDQATDPQLARAFAVLDRACSGSKQLASNLRQALDQRLPTLVERAVGSGVEMVAALDSVVRLVRPHRGAAAASAAVAASVRGSLGQTIHALAVEHHRDSLSEDRDSHLAPLASALHHLAIALGGIGQAEEALAASEESVRHYRELVEERGDLHLPELATSLNSLAVSLDTLLRHEEALEKSEEAVRHYRALVDEDRDRYLPQLGGTLINLSTILANLKRTDGGLAASEESVRHYRELVEELGEVTNLPELAAALGAHSIRLDEAGRRAEALEAGEQSTGYLRKLAAENPGRYLSDLAGSLNNLAHQVTDAERAVELIEEAVTYYGELIEESPAMYLPKLAISLASLSIVLDNQGRPQEALPPIAEAVEIWNSLVRLSPDRYLPNLAITLNSSSIVLGNLGRADEALEASEAAVRHYRALVDRDADQYLPDLAAGLSNLSNRLADVGRQDEALAASEEGVEHRRALVAIDRDRHLPDLAGVLNNLSIRSVRLERYDEALAASEEAVRHWRELVERDAVTNLPELAMSLNNLSSALGQLKRSEEGLEAGEEAVRHYRKLAEQSRNRHLPDLAATLNNVSNRLGEAGKEDEAAKVTWEAVVCWREVAGLNPARYLPSLATTLTALSTRLNRADRSEEALAELESVRKEHAETPGVGVVLQACAVHYEQTGDLEAAFGLAWDALEELQASGREPYRAQTRIYLRGLRARNQIEFDEAWGRKFDHELPAWLRHLETDAELAKLLIEWVKTADWEESRELLEQNPDQLLTAVAEATLEHLIDANPGRRELAGHLEILRIARAEGIEAPYAGIAARVAETKRRARVDEWLTMDDQKGLEFLIDNAAELLDPRSEQELLAFALEESDNAAMFAPAALLSLARTDTPAGAYELLRQRPQISDESCLDSKADPRLLALARLAAGLGDEDAESQFQHAIAAEAAGLEEEGLQAIERCRQLLPSWERQHYRRRLGELAEVQPALREGFDALDRALIGPSPDSTVP